MKDPLIRQDWASCQPLTDWSNRRYHSIRRRQAPRTPLIWYGPEDWYLYKDEAEMRERHAQMLNLGR